MGRFRRSSQACAVRIPTTRSCASRWPNSACWRKSRKRGWRTVRPCARAIAGELVAALRARLDLPAGSAFDETAETAVKAFQADANLAADGLVGRQTLAVLNAGPEEKIEKLRINLERARWFRDLALDEKHIIVNIAGFRVYVFVGEEIAWEARAIVGRTYRKTPLFKGSMTYLVLNPTWTPTVRMVKQDIMPKVLEDPGYLATKNMVVYDEAGALVDPYAADWSNPFQYRIVQQPGPDNALGAVKFMFPNKHAVYLHDTPSRELFNETQRAFSAGCIRVENPIELAEGLLGDQPSWQPDAIKAALASGETKTVHLDDADAGLPALLDRKPAGRRPRRGVSAGYLRTRRADPGGPDSALRPA